MNDSRNTKVMYLYRDASNYKTSNSIIVKGMVSDDQVSEILSCCDGEYFIPEQIGWDLLRGWEINEDDHCFAELDKDSFELTDNASTSDMTVEQMVEAFKACKGLWDAAKYTPVMA